MQEITMHSDQFLGKWEISREFPPLEATQLALPLMHTSLEQRKRPKSLISRSPSLELDTNGPISLFPVCLQCHEGLHSSFPSVQCTHSSKSLHFPQKYAQKRLNLSFQRCNCVTNGEGHLCTLCKSNLAIDFEKSLRRRGE